MSGHKPRRRFRFQTALLAMVVIAFSIPIVFAIFMVAPAIPVSLTRAIPAVIMIEAAALAFPITIIVSALFPTRSDPHCTGVRWVSPITAVPNIAAIYHIPIAVNPHVAGTRWNRSYPVHTRRGWSADSDSDGYLSFKGGRAGQKHCGKQRCANNLSHVLSSLKLKETCFDSHS